MEQGPSFGSPPVIEVQLGLQFDPVPNLTHSHFGLFWSQLGIDAWPFIAELPPLPQQFEKFGSEIQWGNQSFTFNLNLPQYPSGRAQIINAARDRVIQLQNGRFWYSWIGTSGSLYPRYETIQNEAVELFEKFSVFLSSCEFGSPHLNQWEVTYTNHLPRGTVWNDPTDWTRIFNSNAMLPAEFGSNKLEQFNGQWMYVITPSRGRLHVHLQSARDRLGGNDILQLQLIARGPIGDADEGMVKALSGLSLGHETIVNGFRDLTSASAREFWKETR